MSKPALPPRPQITVQAPSSSEVVTVVQATAAFHDDLLNQDSLSSTEAVSSNASTSSLPPPSPPSVLTSPRKTMESELSEAELRRLYDDEEIERFLGLFSDVSHNLSTLRFPVRSNGGAH